MQSETNTHSYAYVKQLMQKVLVPHAKRKFHWGNNTPDEVKLQESEDIAIEALQTFLLKDDARYRELWQANEKPDNRKQIENILKKIVYHKILERQRSKKEFLKYQPNKAIKIAIEDYDGAIEPEIDLDKGEEALLSNVYDYLKDKLKEAQLTFIMFHIEGQFKGYHKEVLVKRWNEAHGKNINLKSYEKQLVRIRQKMEEAGKNGKRPSFILVLLLGCLLSTPEAFGQANIAQNTEPNIFSLLNLYYASFLSLVFLVVPTGLSPDEKTKKIFTEKKAITSVKPVKSPRANASVTPKASIDVLPLPGIIVRAKEADMHKAVKIEEYNEIAIVTDTINEDSTGGLLPNKPTPKILPLWSVANAKALFPAGKLAKVFSDPTKEWGHQLEDAQAELVRYARKEKKHNDLVLKIHHTVPREVNKIGTGSSTGNQRKRKKHQAQARKRQKRSSRKKQRLGRKKIALKNKMKALSKIIIGKTLLVLGVKNVESALCARLTMQNKARVNSQQLKGILIGFVMPGKQHKKLHFKLYLKNKITPKPRLLLSARLTADLQGKVQQYVPLGKVVKEAPASHYFIVKITRGNGRYTIARYQFCLEKK